MRWLVCQGHRIETTLAGTGSKRLKVSVKSDYATRAVLGLSKYYATGKPVSVERLADEYGVSPKYLVQILLALKSSHLVTSVRGKEGGYILAHDPAEITFGSVLRAIDGAILDTSPLNANPTPASLRGAWEAMRAAVDAAADGITFQELLERSQSAGEMYYI